VNYFDNGFLTSLLVQFPWLQQSGYPSLFVISFLASTLIPVGSEWLLVLMLLNGYSPLATFLAASAGNILGACTSWIAGRYGGELLLGRVFRINDRQRQRAEEWYSRYGMISLLFSWLPVVGDPLTLVGGVLKLAFWRFFLLVALGKAVRYAVVVWLTLHFTG
jgi:membrane protein YqaA with SNARE-associated domain